MIKSTCLALLCAIAMTTSANAGILNTVTAIGPNAAAVTIQSVASTETATGSPFVTNGTIDIALDVNAKHLPVDLQFDFGAGGGSAVTNYVVTLRTTNQLVNGNPYMNGFDIQNGGGSLVNGIDVATEPTSDTWLVQYPANTLGAPPGFRFGNLSGGGIGLALGAESIQTFAFQVNGTAAGTAILTFTANPEPGAMLLGALALVPVGVVVRRRRKSAGATFSEVDPA